MKKPKIITAVKARHNLGQILNEVSLRGDEIIIERAGKPMVAVIPIASYELFQQLKNGAKPQT